jgi:hypothetical protein
VLKRGLALVDGLTFRKPSWAEALLTPAHLEQA